MDFAEELHDAQPVSPVRWNQVESGMKLTLYIPGDSTSRIDIEILSAPEPDSREDLIVTYRDLTTGKVHTTDVASIGLSSDHAGNQHRFAIPFDENQ